MVYGCCKNSEGHGLRLSEISSSAPQPTRESPPALCTLTLAAGPWMDPEKGPTTYRPAPPLALTKAPTSAATCIESPAATVVPVGLKGGERP